MAEAENADDDIAASFASMLSGDHYQQQVEPMQVEEAGGGAGHNPDPRQPAEPIQDMPSMTGSDNSMMEAVEMSDSEDEDADVESAPPVKKKPQSQKMPSFGGDKFLNGLSVKPAQATSAQQEARLQSVMASQNIDMWQDAPYSKLKYDPMSWGLMLKKREKYMKKLAATFGGSEKDMTVDKITGVPTGGAQVAFNSQDGKIPDVKDGVKWTKIAQKVARDRSGGPKNLKPGPAGYIPYKLLLKQDRK